MNVYFGWFLVVLMLVWFVVVIELLRGGCHGFHAWKTDLKRDRYGYFIECSKCGKRDYSSGV